MATNGTLTPKSPPSTAISGSVKRKRSVSRERSSTALPDARLQDLHAHLRDLLLVLKGYDTLPSVLEHPLDTSAHTAYPNDLEEPAAKKLRLSPSRTSSIASKISLAQYSSVQQLLEDFDHASQAVLENNTGRKSDSNTESCRHVDTLLKARIAALEGTLRKSIMLLEVRRKTEATGKAEHMNNHSDHRESPISGIVKSGDPQEGQRQDLDSTRSVLTISGSVQGQIRQLFTSLQQPTKVDSGCPGFQPVDVAVPLRDVSLPNGVTVTEIFPVRTEAGEARAKKQFGDVFRPPGNVSQLQPPKPPRTAATRGTAVSWVNPSEKEKPSKYNGFTTQKQKSGDWLGYGGIASAQGLGSPAKRKYRDRALSTGESKPAPTSEDAATEKRAQEEALFRKAYSSFAPTYDNTHAVIPGSIRSHMWWSNIEANGSVPIPPVDRLFQGTSDDGDALVGSAEEIQAFKAAVETWEPERDVDGFTEATVEEEGTKATIETINELIETLHSFHRLRNSNLMSSMPQPLGTSSPKADVGTPFKPSSTETSVYNSTRSQLATLVTTLPPYLLAKLQGDQLKDLAISRSLPMEIEDFRGVMEEDATTRQAKQAAAAAQNIAAVPTTRSNPASYSSRTSTLPQSTSRTNAQGYHSNQTQPPRTSSFNHPSNRPQLNPGGYQTPTVANRTSYGTNGHPQTVPRPQPPNYGSLYGRQPNQYTPQTASANRTYQPSPQTAYSAQPGASQAYSYSSQSGYTQYPYPQRPPPTPYAAQPSTTQSSYPTPSLSSDQQRKLIGQHQAQVMQQAQARVAAQAGVNRQNSGSPAQAYAQMNGTADSRG